jgi:predicted nucleic acid-binding protein
MRSYYIDSSAILSVVFDDANAKAMKPFLGSTFYTSNISRVEVMRAVFRIAPDREGVARKLLGAITIVPIRTSIVNQAERLPEKINIRGMDALHLATANSLDFLRIHGVITYDNQMAKAAQSLGFEVFAPKAQ